MQNKTGLYIVIEGQDGTGKSTQVEKCAEYFREQQRETIIINEGAEANSGLFSTDAIGKILHTKDFGLEPETNLALFTAQRIELWRKKILPTLAKNGIVIASRNWWSTLAYQHFGEGIPRKLIEQITQDLMPKRYIFPDKSVMLILDDDERKKRMKIRNQNVEKDTFDSRAADFFGKVNNGYKQIAQDFRVPIINAKGTKEEVFDKIKKALEI